VLSDFGLALGVAHAQQPGCSWGFRGAEQFVNPLRRVSHFAQNIRISASKLNAEPLTLGLIKIGGKHSTREVQVKQAITLLVGVVMPFGLVVLAGVVASRMLARYHRQWRSDRRTSNLGVS
jgi:hypothetical protein